MSPAPAFEFTHRAIPIVQMGRSAHNDSGNMWGDGVWGSGLWGVRDWEVIWADLTCEVHEITTQTGRGGATDRFVPGTAAIVASNVNQISEMIFPKVPETGEGIELVPQPPIEHEEDLQAPDAATVVSNGWSFTDDFEQAPPRWIFPAAWAASGDADAPCGPFKQMVGGGWEPQRYADSTWTGAGYAFKGSAAAQWTGTVVWTDTQELAVTVDAIVWPAAASGGMSPTVVLELYAGMNKTDRACDCMRVTYTPGFGAGTSTIVTDLFRMGPTGTRVTGLGTVHTRNLGATDGAFPAATFALYTSEFGGLDMVARYNGAGYTSWTDDSPPDGTRLGVYCSFAEGKHTGIPVCPHISHISSYSFDDELVRATGSGWYLPAAYARQDPNLTAMVQADGTMRPPERFSASLGGTYSGDAVAYWKADFDGDQVFEFLVSDVSMPDELLGPANTYIEILVHGNHHDQSAVRCYIQYLPAWGGADSTIDWGFFQTGPNGDDVYFPDVDETIVLGDTGGVFPEPARWRLESDVTGEHRLYYQGTLLGTALFPNPPVGGRVGVRVDWQAGSPDTGQPRPPAARLQQVWAGLQSPLGTEELGMWIRIGVDHDTLGQRWFFRGFVDAVVPTYVPDRPDAVRIECIDALGEAGRVFVDGDQMSHPFAPAPTRIRQILDRASWPAHFRTVGDDATFMSRPSSGKAVDALTQVAESCGGAVYGDPYTGDVVFKGQGWQGEAAGGDTLAYITNYNPGADYFDVPRVCPSGWERSARRSDMTTRVRYSTVTSDTDDGDPIVREWRYPAGERVYGIEKYERTLLCIDRQRVDELAVRQLHLRHPNLFPRIEAVVLDAATADECLDLMTTATFTVPSKYRCQHREADGFVFDRKMLVTGVRHRMTPTRWQCRLTLDPSSPYAEVGGHWDEARWGDGEWGRIR